MSTKLSKIWSPCLRLQVAGIGKDSQLPSALGVIKNNFPGGSDGKAFAYNVGDLGSTLESGRSLGEGNGNPLQYSCLENPMGGGACRLQSMGVTKSRTRLSDFLSFSFHLGVMGFEARPDWIYT